MEDAEEGEGGLVMRGRTVHEQKKMKNKQGEGEGKKNNDILTVAVRDTNGLAVLGEASPGYLQ